MENIIIVLDDAQYALKMLMPMKNKSVPTQWILLACPPRLTRHIGRWVNQASRDDWRTRWAQELLHKLRPCLIQGDDRVEWRVAKGSLVEQTRSLQAEFLTNRVLDVRRPKLGHDHEPVTSNQPTERTSHWTLPGGAAALGVALLMAGD